MKKTVYVVLLLLLLSILELACQRNKPVKIGFTAALSGRFSDSGVKARNGVRVAADQLNENGGILGRKVEIIVKDNKNDTSLNKQVISELINEGVIAIIGPLRSNMAQSTLSAIDEKNILLISPTISTEQVSNLEDNFFRVIPSSTNQAISLSHKVLHDGNMTASIVYDSSNSAYTEHLMTSFKKYFEKKGGVIQYVDNMSDTTQANIANKIIGSGADSLILIMSGIDAASICQQLHKSGSKTSVYGTYWVKSGNLVEDGGRSVEGVTLVTSFERENLSPGFVNFKNSYFAEYKEDPQYLSIYAYDAIQLLFQGIIGSKSFNSEKIKQAIVETRSFQGLKDDFEINKYGDALRKDMFVTVQNGQFVRVKD